MSTVNVHNLPDDLRAIQLETEAHARDYGLDFYDTIFEVLDYDELSEIAALGGFPNRYPHWRFGMEYQQLAKGYRYGLQKIYEMVINNDPCYAYLLRCNQLVDQKLVMAHVYGHNDFFKNNIWFSQTNRKMMDEMANHGNRIRSYMERYGEETVENFIDSCLSLENLIDIYSPLDQAPRGDQPLRFRRRRRGRPIDQPTKFQSKDYMDSFVNPPQVLKEEARKRETEREKEKAKPSSLPEQPERDVLLFLLEHAPLEGLAARRPGDHPRGGLLLRSPGADQDHERGLGVVLALDDHDPEDAPPLGAGRLRRPPLGDDGHAARPAQSLQAGHRAACATSRSAGTRGSSARNGMSATTSTPGRSGTRSSAWAARRSSRSGGSTTT